MENNRQVFFDSKQTLEDNGIRIQRNDGSVCMPLMYCKQDIINYLNTRQGDGLTRLRDLAGILNLPELWGVEYCASWINGWICRNEDLFKLDEEDLYRLYDDAYIYINKYDNDNDELNKYCEADAGYTEEQLTQAKKYNDGMMWFWLGEY